MGKYTYDDSFENSFELIDYFRSDFGTKSLYLFSNNEKIHKALLITMNNF